ncbi:MAG: asparagine synthase (glutamine-hydrolyzing) [Sphingomonas bacterium]|nr:asparagine synthase (glutamine-hydrolyzing) [Sphingomonas bacterium]
MCGIAGLWTRGSPDPALLTRMAKAIEHRGPDDEGVWIDPEAGVGLAHRRLSIVDLSPHGHQPMLSSDGRLALCYNGEIYNHAELRAALDAEGRTPNGGWRGHSDTETLVEAVAAWGLDSTLARSVGMFAFALWDRRERTLHLVRDRFGEKPLYYGWAGRDFVFASELKAIRVHLEFDSTVDRRALHAFAARTNIPAPLSIYRRLFKLEPGCILTLTNLDPFEAPPSKLIRRYWSYEEVVRAGLADPFVDEVEALAALEAALNTAIDGQSVADVPVGAFLSGGIDSSTITAFYQQRSSTPVRTYTIGFDEAGYNEADDARAVAAHLGTIHHEQIVTAAEARDVIPLLPEIYDEPFADSSQIPTFIVSRFAGRDVTVALTGDGGDEVFAGYNRHVSAPAMWRSIRHVPLGLRAAASATLGRLPSSFWSAAASAMPGRTAPNLGAKLHKALRTAGHARDFIDIYDDFLDEWAGERSPVIGGGAGAARPAPAIPDATVATIWRDATGYLPDDILTKVDRASMAVSLETRVPFLDHRVAAVAARIPLAMKVKRSKGKQILREALFSRAPESLFDRPKAGFAVPVGQWIKHPLREWAESLLDPRRLAADGYFDPAIVAARWNDHLSGRRDSTAAMWSILMFQAWLDEQQR